MTAKPTPNFFSLLPHEVIDVLTPAGLPKFRAKQLLDWVYRKGVTDPQAMTNLAPRDRETVANLFDFSPGRIVTRQDSSDGTMKLLLDWPFTSDQLPIEQPDNSTSRDREGASSDADSANPGRSHSASSLGRSLTVVARSDSPINEKAQAETVMIPDIKRDTREGKPRRTACVSNQVGCAVGCKFCASGMNGLKGSLTSGQIVGQIYLLNQILAKENGKGSAGDACITNVVFMGMGEPMANYNNVLHAVRILTHPECVGLGQRRITISTVGVPDRIRRLADEDLSVTLALSLHAPNEPLRRQLIPWAEHFALNDILDACRYYFQQTGREITLEYILLHDVNDRPDHARELAALCKTLRANVNLIRYNEVEALPFQRPQSDAVTAFQNILRNAGINSHVRRSRGRDIDAACGQLRRKQAMVTIGG